MLSWPFKQSASNPRYTAIGLMSGTSLDALDAALVQETEVGQVTVLHTDTVEFPAELKQRLEELVVSGHTALSDLLQIEHHYTELVVMQCQRLIALSSTAVDVIGFHGQTIWHAPAIGSTMQIGHAEWLAENTQVPVVAQFRRGDMARGGQGAPLAPLFHAAHFGRETEAVAVLNLGGIANLTLLYPGQSPVGWDLGPANTLSDQWFYQHHGRPFDANGAFASTGQAHPDLLDQLLSDPYFKAPPPKSTGREHFNLAWLANYSEHFSDLHPADIQATLNQLTARLVSKALPDDIELLVVCGGGVRNSHLMDCIDAAVDALMVTSDTFDIDPLAVESACFAWLAIQRLRGVTPDVRALTGAKRNGLLGHLYLPTRD